MRAQAQASELRNQLLIVQHEAQEAISAGDKSVLALLLSLLLLCSKRLID